MHTNCAIIDDIFLKKKNKNHSIHPKGISPPTLCSIQDHTWTITYHNYTQSHYKSSIGPVYPHLEKGIISNFLSLNYSGLKKMPP